MAGRRRLYRIVHEPYLFKFLVENFPPGTWDTNVRVGMPDETVRAMVPEERWKGMLLNWMGRVDALVLLPDKVILIEAFIRNQFGKVEQLLYYDYLFEKDPRFKEHWDKPRELWLVTPINCPPYFAFARKFGIKPVLYIPHEIVPYLETLTPRERTGKRRAFPISP